ncbi:hypothetical protein PSTG_06367 [Puccinia striiformis f. sp. tritici PST-78]|uniref:Uncharacterized protein n=1 Tax=Puccinia striiformis f. sp. tritici PST-78 TaxID=1165861 RepID=A0A0L0VMD8_9BASI|nr:hypothetical protein PSTG_06367 [Puccinia striiformis f. sp. tritici PST-78]
MNVIKATLLVFLAGLSEFAIACSSNVPSDNHGCLESDEVHYCCRKGALVENQDYELEFAKGAGCHQA